LRETAELCIRKAHYAADQLTKIPGIKLRFDRPFFKEFTIQITGEAKSVLHRLLDHGYHGGIAMGSFYPWLGEGIGIAVTERRTRTEIDGLADAYRNTLKG
jgi:glycine dehydrogenase subunit 1